MSKKKNVRQSLSAEDAADIIANLYHLRTDDRLLLALLIFTGMRKSEALGLRWEDIDFSLGLIHVQHAATFRGNRPVLGPTKSSAGVRYIPLDPQLRAIPLPLRQYSGYLLGQDEPITQMTYKRAWERIGKTIDLHGATAHILCHTYITMAVPYVDIKTLQSIADHADICTTMNRYAHGRVDKVIEAGRALEGMFLG